MNVSSLTVLLAALAIAPSASAENISFGTSTPPTGMALAASNWDRELEARSWQLFPLASQWQRRLNWLQEQENIKLDRAKGTTYSIRVR
jgi:hypothetical protein